MVVKFETSALKETKWYEYIVRFFFGGLITVAAGAIAKEWGPAAGGLFLAFPAIFPASATLLEKHERRRKQSDGAHGERRGIAAGSDAAGAAMGSAGLVAFAAICWFSIPRYDAAFALAGAAIVWLFASVSIWFICSRGEENR